MCGTRALAQGETRAVMTSETYCLCCTLCHRVMVAKIIVAMLEMYQNCYSLCSFHNCYRNPWIMEHVFFLSLFVKLKDKTNCICSNL